MKRTVLFSLLSVIAISISAQQKNDALLSKSDSCKGYFINDNLTIRASSYTFQDYLTGHKPFTTINIRSDSDGHPIYVIDGTIVSRDSLETFNVSRIKSLTVLKDGSATRLYGEKARDGGVVIITTARGKMN